MAPWELHTPLWGRSRCHCPVTTRYYLEANTAGLSGTDPNVRCCPGKSRQVKKMTEEKLVWDALTKESVNFPEKNQIVNILALGAIWSPVQLPNSVTVAQKPPQTLCK